MTERVRLGTVIAPSGVLVVVDPGYAALWTHTEQDFDRGEGWSFEEEAIETSGTSVDVRIAGPDAAEAGRRFNRQWHNLWLYDIPKAEFDALQRSFDDVLKAHDLDASLEICPRRIPHRERTDYAIDAGGGAGEIQVHGVMNAVCGGIPTDSELHVYAEFMPEGENETRWRRVYVEAAPGRQIASSERIGGSGVDWARLMFIDADALGAWGQGQSLDGLADLIFWGADAEAAARALGAARLDDVRFGWRDVPLEKVDALDDRLTAAAEQHGFRVARAYWPHSNHWRLMREVWASPHEAASIDLGASRLCGFMTSWGDAVFDVLAERDAEGRLVRLTVDCGCKTMEDRHGQLDDRRFGELSKLAIATRSVMEEGKPVAFLFREEAVGDTDSGWFVTGGEEPSYFDDPQNVVLVRLSEVIRLAPRLDDLLQSPTGSAFMSDAEGVEFVPAEFPYPLDK